MSGSAMPRRRMLLTGALALATSGAVLYGVPQQVSAAPAPVVAPSAVAASTVAASSRPNIVLVMADDMRTDDLRFMPSVRRLLRREGLEFRNSFSPYPLCCPARASLLTGRYAHNHKVFSHAAPWGFKSFNDRRTLATALNGAGYNTGFIGKYLNGYGAQRSLVTGESSFRYVPRGWTDWYGAVSRPPGSRYTSGGTYNYMHTIFNVNGRIDDTHRGQYQTNVIGSFARKLVGKYHRSTKPFFLYVSSVAPHFGGPGESDDPSHVRTATGGYVNIKTPARPKWVRGKFDGSVTRAAGRPLSGPSEADISDKPSSLRRLPEPNAAVWRGILESTRQRAEAEYVLDQEVGRLVAKLKSTGEYANTVFMFTSDNGYFLGEHRVVQGKIKPQEPSLRVPFLVAGKGIPHGQRFDPMTTPSLTATIADLAGATMPFPADGSSLVPSIRGGDRGWTVPVVTEGRESASTFPGDARTTIGLRMGRWKYVRYANGNEELYDLDADPNELESLHADPAHAELEDQLRLLWSSYKDCVGETCRVDLPVALQRTPADNAAGTEAQSAGVHSRYGYWR
jgi:N-acetylglucosamine-6-sulfatase